MANQILVLVQARPHVLAETLRKKMRITSKDLEFPVKKILLKIIYTMT